MDKSFISANVGEGIVAILRTPDRERSELELANEVMSEGTWYATALEEFYTSEGVVLYEQWSRQGIA